MTQRYYRREINDVFTLQIIGIFLKIFSLHNRHLYKLLALGKYSIRHDKKRTKRGSYYLGTKCGELNYNNITDPISIETKSNTSKDTHAIPSTYSSSD